eukprot:scaffold279174_cov16-Prasinocladus_malaysianus.AAC.1
MTVRQSLPPDVARRSFDNLRFTGFAPSRLRNIRFNAYIVLPKPLQCDRIVQIRAQHGWIGSRLRS